MISVLLFAIDWNCWKNKWGIKMEQTDIDFMVKRLRRVAGLLGLADAIPADDETIAGAAGTVLGMVARNVEKLKTENSEYRCLLQVAAYDLNQLRAKIESTLSPNSGMATRETSWHKK